MRNTMHTTVASFSSHLIEVFTNSPKHKNAIIANSILAVPLKMNNTDKISNFEMHCSFIHVIQKLDGPLVQIKKKNGNTKLTLMSLLPIVCVCENLEYKP